MSDATTLLLADTVSATNALSIAVAGTSTINVATGTGTLSGIISGAGMLAKTGGGTLGLSGVNTYSTGTTLSAGTIALGSNTGLGTGTLTMSNATTLSLANTVSATNALSIAVAGTSTIDVTTGTGTLSGIISGAGTLAKTGAGTLGLSGVNTYSTGTTLSAGAIALGSNTGLGTGTLTMSDTTTLFLANTVSATNALSIAGTSTVDVTTGTGTLSGIISGAGTLAKTGAGTLGLTGVNTYSTGTTLSAGTISLGNSASLGSGTLAMSSATTLALAGGVNAGNVVTLAAGTETINVSSGTGTLSGAIGGTGALTKTGSGILVLSGTNGYSGGTTVNGGTLRVSSNANLGNTAGNVNIGAATLQLSASVSSARGFNFSGGSAVIDTQANNVTLSGAIQGAGALQKEGSGILTLSGLNTSGGGVLINAGTVSFDTGLNNITVLGAIQGAGVLKKVSSGDLILAGTNNTYSGGTLIEAGTVSVADGGSLGTGDVTINAATIQFTSTTSTNLPLIISGPNNTIDVNNGFVATVGGVISGVGADLVKSGLGTLNLTQANTYTGTTTVTAGTLRVNGSITSDVTVDAGATLGGAGTITGDVFLSGTVAPGNSIDTLNIVGDFTFNTGSLFENEVSGDGSTDVLVATGNIIIQPGVELDVLLAPGEYPSVISYNIITGASVTGTFDTVMLIPPRFSMQVFYTSTQVRIQLGTVSFADLVQSGNAGAVARCFNSLDPTTGTDSGYVMVAVGQAPSVEAIINDLNQMQPSLYNALAITQENTSLRVRSVFSERTDKLIKHCTQGQTEKAIDLWVTPIGDFTKQWGLGSTQPGYESNTEGAFLGVDILGPEQFGVGFSGGYTHSTVRWNESVAKGNIDSYYGGIYGRWTPSLFYTEFSLLGASNGYRASRRIQFQNVSSFPVDRNAFNDHGGAEIAGHLGFGFVWDTPGVNISPIANIDYMYLYEDEYQEHGANSLDLSVQQKSSDLFRTEVGSRFSRCFSIGQNGILVPDAKLSWIFETRFQGRKTEASFVDSSCVFSVYGFSPTRNLFSPSVGLTFFPSFSKLSVSARYDAEFGKDFWQQGATASFSYQF
jgi:outer membrane autotransporter protein